MESHELRLRRHYLREFKYYSLKVIAIAILIFVAILMLFPYLYMVCNSFKSTDEIINTSFKFYLFPKEFSPGNYKEIFKHIPLHLGFKNTLVIELLVLTVGTFTTTLAAFAFSRLKFVGRNIVFYVLLSGMMIPFVSVFVPQYNAWSKLNLYDTLWPLIIPGFFGNTGMLFFLKQYADSIPNEVYEAADIDGAGYFTTYFRLFLPLVRPAILAQVIFWFLGIWNDFFGPDLYLPSLDKKTLQIMIKYFSGAEGGAGEALANQPYIMSASVLSSIPTLIIYIVFQKYFVNTFMLSGVKK